MSNPQIEEIKITKVVCNIATHQRRNIEAMCLQFGCKENSALCSKCVIKGHSQCQSQINDFDFIRKQLMELQELSLNIVMIQKMINDQFKELLFQIELILKPIFQYSTYPNLTNLNEIGYLLRTQPQQQIFELIDQKNIQIRLLLDNHNLKSEIPQKQQQEKVKNQVEELPKYDAHSWYLQGRTLGSQGKYNEAIECFDQAIHINPNNYMYWYLKGQTLQCSDKYFEEIKCFDEAIRLNPKHENSWCCKGISLSQLGRFEEAIKCFQESLKHDPTLALGLLKEAKEAIKKKKK